MRRLDLRPDRKLRNPGRHLRQLARWPARIVTQIPPAADLEGARFWNWKVPVYSKLVEGRFATPEAQRACIAAIFAAAEAIERSPARPADSRIACLVTTPFLFESEVTLFLDEDYFRSFLPVPGSKRTAFDGGWIEGSLADPEAITNILPLAPAGLECHGGTRLLQHDDEWEATPVERFNWVWAFPRR
jgi:uncharacterized protein DUF3916